MVQAPIKKWELLVLGLILIIAAFCRIYRIPDFLTFLGDEGRDVLVMKDIIQGKHFPLIGPGTSVGNMYLGPLYYYLVAPSLILSGLSPVGPAVEVALIGVLTVALLWWVGRSWFNRPLTALLISFLYGISPSVIIYSRSSWNPNIMPFFALLTIYSLWQVWRVRDNRWLPFIGLSLAFVLNSHYLGLLLFPTVIIFLFISRNIWQSKTGILHSVFIFLVLMSPLLLFDLRHNWTNLYALKTFFLERQSTVNLKAYKALPNLWPIWEDVVSNLLSPRNQQMASILSVAAFFSSVLILIRRRLSSGLIITLVWLLVGIVGLGLYKQHIYLHYYGFLFPAPFLLFGFLTERISRFWLPLTVVIIVIFIQANPFNFSANFQMSRTKEISDFITADTSGRPFNLGLISDHNYDAGYRYFLDLKNSPHRTIHEVVTDRLYVICEMEICKPVGNPLWDIAAFGWTKIDRVWILPWGTKLFLLSHYEK